MGRFVRYHPVTVTNNQHIVDFKSNDKIVLEKIKTFGTDTAVEMGLVAYVFVKLYAQSSHIAKFI
jgi:hypothetical protein